MWLMSKFARKANDFLHSSFSKKFQTSLSYASQEVIPDNKTNFGSCSCKIPVSILPYLFSMVISLPRFLTCTW